MGKFLVECPDCGSYVELGTGLFEKKKVTCACGKVLTTKENRYASKVCPHCGNKVMFDQSKGDNATCPMCHKPINTVESKIAFVQVKCPECATMMKVNKKSFSHTCTICGKTFDTTKLLAQVKLQESGTASVVSWEGSQDVIIYKHPIESFNAGSQLIVKQGQEAIVMNDGVVAGVYGAGRHIINANENSVTDEEKETGANTTVNVIQTEVYFINKILLTGIKWGTPTKVRVMEQTLNFPVELGARGSFNLEITDSRTFISRLVGSVQSAVTESEDGGVGYGTEFVRAKFADMIGQNVVSMLARIIEDNKINLLTINTMYPVIAKILGNSINGTLVEFGLQIPASGFYIQEIVMPENDPNFIRFKNQFASSLDLRDAEIALTQRQADAKIDVFDAEHAVNVANITAQGVADTIIIEAKSEAEKTKIEGQAVVDVYRDLTKAEADALTAKGGDYKMETERIVGEALAEGGITMVNVKIETQDTWTCKACGKKDITSKFCPDCGAKKE